jgi:hypothetical protein
VPGADLTGVDGTAAEVLVSHAPVHVA